MSHSNSSPGAKFKRALSENKLLQILGTVNPMCAILAKHAGAKCVYQSGFGLAYSQHGLPDLGITNLHDVADSARRIALTTDLPLMIDIDTGFGSAFGIARTIKTVMQAGVAAVHMEDQVSDKRCGHRPGKQLVELSEMVDRIKAADQARKEYKHLDPDFVIIARTDALASEGMEETLKRSQAYIDAGADMLFPEACRTLEDYRTFKNNVKSCTGEPVKILANIVCFGKTPLFTTSELHSAGVDMVLYPVDAFFAMNRAALEVYQGIIEEGTSKGVLQTMMPFDELYEIFGYQKWENLLDKLYSKKKSKI